ncbi:MAG: hypothetical protein Q9167_004419 [Letrouitia subvulpina]
MALPRQNIVDCANPSNETFQAPAPSLSASVTLTLKSPSTLATLLSPTTKRPTGPSVSPKPISSPKPKDSSGSAQPECNDSSQRRIDIGLGVTVGILGSLIVASIIAYVSPNRLENRGGYDPRRDDDHLGNNGPGGGSGPGRNFRPRRGKDRWDGSDYNDSGGNVPGGGDGPNKSYRPRRNKDRWEGNDNNDSNEGNDPRGGNGPSGTYRPENGYNDSKGGRSPSQSSNRDRRFPPKDRRATTGKEIIVTGSHKIQKSKLDDPKRDPKFRAAGR